MADSLVNAKRSQKSSIKDVAERAGVSITTVSRVINNSSHPVNDQTRVKVLQAVQELDYAPNALAKAMVTKDTFIVGVIVGDAMDPYFAAIVRGVEDVAREMGYLVIVANSDREPGLEYQYLKTLNEYNADGVIFAGGGLKDKDYLKNVKRTLEQLKSRGAPVITLGDHLFPSFAVRVDNQKVSYEATSYLLDLGHRDIGYITGPETLTTSQKRYEGFKWALDENGGKEYVFDGDYTYQGGIKVAETVSQMSNPPTAILASNDLMAIGCIIGLGKFNISIPQDISVMGIDNIQASQFVSPALSSVSLPLNELGARGMEKLIQFRAGQIEEKKEIILDHELKIRDSTIRYSKKGC